MEWIKILDRLPDNGQWVMCYPGFQTFLFGEQKDQDGIYGIENKFTDWDDDWEQWKEVFNLTHWMPLPEPPKK